MRTFVTAASVAMFPGTAWAGGGPTEIATLVLTVIAVILLALALKCCYDGKKVR